MIRHNDLVRTYPPTLERFEAQLVAGPRVDGLAGRCLLFTGRKSPSGAGRFRLGSQAWSETRAHRYAWSQAFGPIADGVLIIHLCPHRSCVNVAHLAEGDRADLLAVQRAHRHGAPKKRLAADDVRAIRSLWASGDLTEAKIGAMFGVGQWTVSNLINGKTYTEVQ